jgi:hypothetical protein
MSGKQANEQGFRRGPCKGFGNCSMGRMQNKKSRFQGQGGWNQKNDQCKRVRKRGPEFDQNNKDSQPLTETSGA